MEQNYKFTNISDRQLRQMGVQALADRPNVAQQYGQSGLTPTALKLWFDKLATLLSEKVNELQNAIQGPDAIKYIGLAISEYNTLDDFMLGVQDGSFAENVLMLLPNENSLALDSLQNIIYGIAQSFSEVEEQFEDFDNRKIEKYTEEGERKIYAVSTRGQQEMVKISEAAEPDSVASYTGDGSLMAKMADQANKPPSEVVNTAYVDELKKNIVVSLKTESNAQTHEVSVSAVNIFGETISKATISLPVESILSNVEYTNGKVVLILDNGNRVQIPATDIIQGLVSSEQHQADLKELDDKFTAYFEEYVEEANLLLGGAYVDYS